jgi:hypothetical protein
MNTYKRSFEDAAGYSAFHFPRNVRARLCLRQQLAPPPLSRSHFRPILKSTTTNNSSFADAECKENLPRDANCHQRSPQAPKVFRDERTTRIRFHQKVAVHCIPARHHYSDEERRGIWNDMRELRVMARRNTIEFASEGYDWRRATEDDAMINGIHPVWEQHRDFQPYRSKIRTKSRGADV